MMIELELMRKKIDEIDDKLLVLFKERLEVSKKIGLLKKKHNMKIFDPQREQEIIDILEFVVIFQVLKNLKFH